MRAPATILHVIVLVTVGLSAPPSHAGVMPAECRKAVHAVQDAIWSAKRDIELLDERAYSLMELGNDILGWSPEDFELGAEQLGTLTNKVGTALSFVTFSITNTHEKTMEALDCIERRWPD